jgi:hypothetical protein
MSNNKASKLTARSEPTSKPQKINSQYKSLKKMIKMDQGCAFDSYHILWREKGRLDFFVGLKKGAV